MSTPLRVVGCRSRKVIRSGPSLSIEEAASPAGKSAGGPVTCLSSPFRKNILIFRRPKSVLYHHRPVPQRGDTRSSRPRDGMRWTRMVLKTSALEADGEVVWSRRPDAGVKFALRRAGDGGK